VIEWLGPIVHEYFAATEGNGMTFISAADWLGHPGSVGRPMLGVPHVCDEDGGELPAGETGLIYFEQEQASFEYHGDPEKTRASRHPEHDNWSALGDIGYVDKDGYIYLTDRKAFTIISGGVNIYPAEIDAILLQHPAVGDVATIGVPDEEWGESVKAVVQLADGIEPSAELASELLAFCRDRLAHFKCPRSIDFTPQLPREDTGKIYKRVLREQYRAAAVTRPQ
jgi:acyl-coenzyme A synthetase/AMP-(fatty) acid ligase